MIDALEELKTKNIVEGSEDSERIDYVLNNTLDSLEMWKLPVKDAVSREKVLEIFKDVHPLDYNANAYKTKIENLPPVYPKQKTGHWIMPVQDDGMSDNIYYQVRCSECGFDLDPQTWHQELHQYGADKYCPNCGAKMEGVQE